MFIDKIIMRQKGASKRQIMRTEEKTNVKNRIGWLVMVVALCAFQIYWIITVFSKLNDYSSYIETGTRIVAFIVVLCIFSEKRNAAIKMPWIIFILILPVAGLVMYALAGRINVTKKMRVRYEKIDQKLRPMLMQDAAVADRLREENRGMANFAHYIRHYGHFPVYDNTDVTFYNNTTDALEAQKEALRQAKHYIFMEYYAIEDDVAFHEVLDILTQKAKEGVEVRLFYDDIGSVQFINRDFIKRMEARGIACRDFNPVVPFLNVFMNNRDHRKFTVIDGRVAFTGGYNLANEYFNLTHPFGHWKDTGVRLIGTAARSFTIMFFEMWNAVKDTDLSTDTDYAKYLPGFAYQSKEAGYVQPYADSPLDDERVGENVYMNLIKNAKDYFYISTPYLIITDELAREFRQAAKRGVDVRIITPGVPDKKVVYQMTRSYYSELVRGGVRIYEYTPGFIHAKQCVSDDHVATVGTINLDYRSLYLHFECGTLIMGKDMSAVHAIKDDFDALFPICKEVTDRYRDEHISLLRQLWQAVLRLIAPLV